MSEKQQKPVLDTEFEQITPWNGANDTGNDVRMKWMRNFERVKGDLEKLSDFINVIQNGLDDKFLHKDREDSTNYLLSLLGGVLVKKNLKVGDFITGVIGALIDEIGNAEFETIFARKKIFTPEIAYNRITYVKGKWVVSPGGGCTIDEVVDNGDGTWTVKPDLTEADGLSQFKGDILSTYFVTKSDEGKLTGFEEMKFRVESADYTEKTFVLTAKPDTNWAPQPQMVLAQGGNFIDTDRQSYTVIEAVNGNNCITFFEDANTWDPEPAQMKGWLGKKKGMTVQGINCDNYSAVFTNLLLIGTIFQIDEITGESVRVPIWKGEWKKDNKYGYYNEVSHNGSRYLCVNPDGTKQEPGTGNHWMVTVEKGEQGTPGLSVVGGGDWDHSKIPYAASTIVSMYNCVFCSKKETSNPPLAIARFKDGSLIAKPGGYILAGKSDDLQVNEDWDMILDGRQLKGESITFLGRFDTAPSDPNEGDSYYDTNDKVTYIYRNGVWMIWITDGKDGKGYEYIFRRTTTMMAPDKPDSQNVDEYVPEGWTDDPQGVTADFQLEWCCKRTKTDGVWSEFSTPAPAYRWAKDGESNVLADLDNEMVSCALTYDGKATKAQSWVTNIGMWYGLEQLALESVTYKDNGVFTVSPNKQTGAVTVSVTSGAIVPETTNIRLTLMALKSGQQYSRELVFTIAGVRAGSDGSDAVLYSLVPSVSSVKRTASGSYSVASVSCKRQKTVGGTISDTTDGTLMYSLDGGMETTIANGSGISCSSFSSSVKFVFYIDNRIVDVETIPMVTDGASGSDGKGIDDVDVVYYLSDSPTSLTGGSWVTVAPKWVDGKYLWTKTVTLYSDGSSVETPAVCLSGGKGPAGVGISDIKEFYYLSDSPASLTGGSWVTESPKWTNGKYLWTKTIIYYTDKTNNETTPICVSGADGLSVVGGGDWSHTKIPYAANTVVSMYNCVFFSKKETSNPPLAIARFKDGSLIAKPGGYILAGKSDDLQVNEDWDMILDGQQLKGESITFLGRFDTAPSDPKEGESYYNTSDRATYIYKNGSWMLTVSDGKDGRDYEYIYTRRNSEDEKPARPDSQQVDDYVPAGWTDDFLGVSEDFQLEWGCKRSKIDGVWSEWSDPAPVYRWAKDGESNVLADLDNEMVSCALTYDGKATKAQSWVTNIGMWYGLEQLTLESVTYKDNGVFTVSPNKQTGAVTVSVTSGASVPETTNIRLTLMALKSGQQYSRELVFTIAGVRAGSDGSDAVLYSLVPSVSSVKRTASGSYSVASVSCKRQKTVGGTISDTTDGTLMYSLDGGMETTIANGSGISCSSFSSSVKFLFYVNSQLVDVETIPMVIDGTDGEEGKGIQSSDVMFYLSNSPTSLTGGSWVTDAPQWVDGKYFWTKTVIQYTDGSKKETTPVCISGGKGPSGVGISKIEEQYYLSTSRTSLTGGSWSTTAPSWQSGKYIWTRTAVYYTDGNTFYTSAICAAGQDGIDGSSIVSYGDWSHTKVPIPKNGLVQFTGGSYVAVRDTSNPPYPIARYSDGTLIAKRNGGYILAGRSADRVLNADWVMVVDKPVSNVTYWLSSLVSTINFTSSGYPSPSSVLVTCMQSVDGNVSKCSDMYLAARKYDGSTWYAHVSATKVNSLSVPANKGYTQFAVRAYASASDANSWNENYVAELGIGCSFDGSDGRAGSAPYDMGVWKSGTTYYWNESRRDSVIMLFSNVYYKFQVRNFGASVTEAPSSATGDTNWEAVGRHESIATDTLFADGANIAGFMFSRQGYSSAGVPYGLLRSQNEQDGQPVFYVNTKTGELYSQKGKFVNIEAQGTFSTKSSGERIVLDFASNSIKFIAADEKNYGTLGFADNNGYRSSYLSMSNNNNEYASLQPGWLRVRAVNAGSTIISDLDWGGLKISKNGNTRSVALINDSITFSDSSNSKAIIIKSDAITVKEGSTQYTGVDGSFTFKDQYEKTVIVYFRKGICYRISS